MIRYRTRDITRLRRAACPCGRTFVAMEKVTGRSDDMMIVSGVNVFPSQIESVLMEFDEIEPQYVIHLFKKGFIDNIRVETEAKAALYAKGAGFIEHARRAGGRPHRAGGRDQGPGRDPAARGDSRAASARRSA